MRIASWGSFVVALIAIACSDKARTGPATPVSVAGASTENGRTRIDLQVGSTRKTVRLARDDNVSPAAQPRDVRIVSEVPGAAVTLVMTFPSTPGGLSFCQAGEEQFLYVISLVNDARATYETKLASCRTNLELAEPGLQWDAGRSVLRIHWLIGPSGMSEDRSLAIGPGGETSIIPG